MPWVAEVGRNDAGTSNQSSLPVTLSAAVPVGGTLLLGVQAPVVNAITNFAATDTKSNTWVQRAFKAGATLSNVQMGVLSCQVTTALAIGDVVTITAPPRSPTFWAACIQHFDDLTGFDVAATATDTVSTWPTGTTAAASQDAQLLFGAWAWASPTTTPSADPAGFTMAATVSSPNTPKNLRVGWQYVNTAGTRSATMNYGSNLQYAAAMVAMNQDTTPVNVDYGYRVRNASGDWVQARARRFVGGVWT